ncbi:hypothetical protein Clacol_003366 [Clathrus columnatus]|uniref:Uncharacterized protein n=1 Tax=Clathrus columnatus TaxID=1419009 RepID=A0AAV5A8S8_9AGAM|nr:hypothetical protein Clacol_003366 [Clathrus columnatus]
MRSLRFGEQTYTVLLDESKTDPIRGQLEDPRNTPKEYPGWRWLQCTEYPGQCRVLIPPKIATIYARLLEAEKWELGTYLFREDGRPDIVWERVIQLRALKSKMLRRCIKHAELTQQGLESAFQPFQTHAAPDFTVISLEKWAKTVPFFGTGMTVSTLEHDQRSSISHHSPNGNTPNECRSANSNVGVVGSNFTESGEIASDRIATARSSSEMIAPQ